MASSFFSLEDPGYNPGVWWLSFLLGYGCGCEVAGCMTGADAGFRLFLFCLQIIMKIKIFNSIENKSTPSFSRTPLWCVAGIFCSDKFTPTRKGYIVLV